jgi:hypothetical protein
MAISCKAATRSLNCNDWTYLIIGFQWLINGKLVSIC